MLKPGEVKNIEFTKAISGYKCIEVDDFIDRIAEDYAEMTRNVHELNQKLEVVAAELDEYRRDEENMKIAMDKIRHLAEKTARDAKRESQKIIQESQVKADRILIDARKELELEKRNIERLQLETSRFKAKVISLLKNQIEQMNGLPSVELSPQDALTHLATEYHEEVPDAAAESSDVWKHVIPEMDPSQITFESREVESEEEMSDETVLLETEAPEEKENRVGGNTGEDKKEPVHTETAEDIFAAQEVMTEDPEKMKIRDPENILADPDNGQMTQDLESKMEEIKFGSDYNVEEDDFGSSATSKRLKRKNKKQHSE